MTPHILSTSSITGTRIRNRQGENLGNIKDLMINTETAGVAYAVVSFGGFLGLGVKYFAIPLEAFEVDTDNEQFVLNLDRRQLENAPGFDKDNWPTTANDTFIDQVYQHYGFTRRSLATADTF
jgi:sporulation protein YlmC with PRC-barrel domain